MAKTPRVVHQSFRLSPEAPACDVYMPADKGLLAAHQEDGSFFISPGLGSVKADYGRLSRYIATKGFVVFSPNCNEALPESSVDGALDRRAEVLIKIIEECAPDRARIIAHSLGGPVTFRVLAELGVLDGSNNTVESVSFMQPAGFDKHGPADIFRATKFYFNEAIPRTSMLLPGLVRDPKSVYERINPKQRLAEVRELWNLPTNYMQESTVQAHDAGVFMNFFIGPKDELTRPEPIRRTAAPIVGDHNVHDIHPEAGHLVAQTHSKHMSGIILEKLGLLPEQSLSRVA